MTIGALVERERRHLQRRELTGGLLLAAGALAFLLAAGAVVFGGARWLTLPRALPFAVWALIAVALVLLGLRTRHRLAARGSPLGVALAIEREQRMRRGVLVGALEMEGTGALAARAAEAARATLPHDGALAPQMRRASTRSTQRAAAMAAAGVLLLLSATPLFGDGLRAVLRPIDAWRGALLERPRIQGAPHDLLRGSPLRLTVHAPGRRSILLTVRQTGEPSRLDTLAVDARSGEARWSIESMKGDVRLVASDGRAESDSVVVFAADRPFLGALVLHVDYPSYLGRAAESLPVGERLRLPRGSVLSVSGRASVPLTEVSLAPERGAQIPLATSGHTFAGRFAVEQTSHFAWSARGPAGAVPDLPEPLVIEALADSAPMITITEPTSDTLVATDERLTLGVRASDDHGIRAVELRLTRGAGAASTVQPVASGVGTTWAGDATIDVASLHLAVGETMRVRAEAVDASPWGQRGVSRELVVKRPSMEEQRGVARAIGDSAVKAARAAVAAQQSLAQRTDEAARAQARQGSAKSDASAGAKSAAQQAQQKGAMPFEGAEKARALAQEQRGMADRVQKLREATQQLERQLKAAGALDSALARQLSEAQALLRQALTPEMQAQMQKLESSAQQMNADQSRDALRDMAQMQQRMKEQLEKSAEILKRAAHEGAMQTLGDEARELAKKERTLADSAAAGTPEQKTAGAREAAKLSERTARLRQEMENLKSRLSKDRAESGATKTEEAEQHASKSETGMRRASNEMKSGDRSNAGENKSSGGENKPGSEGAQRARDAADEMDRAAKSMQDARAEQVKEWKKELTSELDQSAQEMMQLAREERSLEQKARNNAQGDERRGAQSAVEQGVEKANERLQGAGKKSALLSPRSQRAVADARNKVSQATQSVSAPTPNSQQQVNALSEAADALTKAAASLARDREKANSASSASGFSEMMQQMQEMAQKQGKINAGAQGLMQMPNGSGSPGAQGLTRALAQQQRALAEQLDDAGDGAGGNRAEQMAREARQLADALDAGRVDGSTLARQQQLFRRLLDAGKSLEKEERDESGKREAKSATGADRFVPPGAPAAKAAIRFRPPTWQELRALSPDERRAILDYFTRLNSAPTP